MGPLELLYSWQSLLCAAAAFGITQTVKRIVDVVYEKKIAQAERTTVRKKAEEKGIKSTKMTDGELKRRVNPVLNRIVIPIVPVVAGILYAVVIPLRPETLVEYADAHLTGTWVFLGFAGWGGACGQFSTMLFDKVKDLIKEGGTRT